MLDQLVAILAQRTGLPPEKAREGLDAVIAQLKTRLPAPFAAHLDSILAGGVTGDVATGIMGDLESRAKDMLGGMLK